MIGGTLALSNLGSLTAGATDHLRVTLTLPERRRQHAPEPVLDDHLRVHRHPARGDEQVAWQRGRPRPNRKRSATSVALRAVPELALKLFLGAACSCSC